MNPERAALIDYRLLAQLSAAGALIDEDALFDGVNVGLYPPAGRAEFDDRLCFVCAEKHWAVMVPHPTGLNIPSWRLTVEGESQLAKLDSFYRKGR
ncbi:MAG: hypothetical protein LBK60_02400 [Verrucomicrobiales bacterium]|jgi:hypothetical protein|nr:hypothetical protein [Verrucomicrobiales bacterium]